LKNAEQVLVLFFILSDLTSLSPHTIAKLVYCMCVLVYLQTHDDCVEILLVLTTSFAVSCAYHRWLAIKKCMHYHVLTDVKSCLFMKIS